MIDTFLPFIYLFKYIVAVAFVGGRMNQFFVNYDKKNCVLR